ncbi:hypothetical protein Q31b_03310 [Novipirellula aureliae]|uniref:FlgN protein n=1 Tax=Novipirellula aureliae TaxID=2527966 RepID=A0A5C6E8K1_9BACT|nr:hypothetical protein [Novipirellula aureliae]TWU45160.1 hypothetical protein Q31b_03310 [Novipirellula aureliae]
MTHPIWHQRVRDYVDRLERVADSIERILSKSTVSTAALDHSDVTARSGELIEAVGELETLVAERESLLLDAEAPPYGTTLLEKLHAPHRDRDNALASRAKRVSEAVAISHQRALSLFVCQFHLASYTSDVVRMLSGTDTPPTYRASSNAYGQKQPEQTGGGRLFNDAA